MASHDMQDQPEVVDVDLGTAVERIDGWVDGFIKLLPNLGVALIFVIVAWFVARFLGHIVKRSSTLRGRSDLGEMVGSFVRWSLFLVGLLLALTIVLPSLKPGDLIAGLGVSSVAIGFAFKDILQNWLAGILLLLRQPFEIGDEIVVGDFEGTVEKIESRATIIRTYDGRKVVIPNAELYTDIVTVLTAYDQRRSEMDFGIGYDDDIDKAQALILETLEHVAGVEADPAPQVIPWRLDASWVTIRARWWTKSKGGALQSTRATVLRDVKAALDAAGIDMPFDTQVQLVKESQTKTTEAG